VTGFRVLVADDEPLARAMVAGLLREDPEVGQIIECGDGAEAVRAITEQAADIAFLDVEMPEIDGLEIASRLSAGYPAVVFVTAFSEYAAQAFDVRAVDYVVKPFSDVRFREAVTRAKERVIERRARTGGPAEKTPYLDRLVARSVGRLVVIPVAQIVWIEAQDYYVRIHSATGRHMLRATLASLESRLDPARFMRVHRAAIVNLAWVRSVDEAGGLQITLSTGELIPVSRARRREVEAALAAGGTSR
jgi:two-component system LytT family response regulator